MTVCAIGKLTIFGTHEFNTYMSGSMTQPTQSSKSTDFKAREFEMFVSKFKLFDWLKKKPLFGLAEFLPIYKWQVNWASSGLFSTLRL